MNHVYNTQVFGLTTDKINGQLSCLIPQLIVPQLFSIDGKCTKIKFMIGVSMVLVLDNLVLIIIIINMILSFFFLMLSQLQQLKEQQIFKWLEKVCHLWQASYNYRTSVLGISLQLYLMIIFCIITMFLPLSPEWSGTGLSHFLLVVDSMQHGPLNG